MQASDFIDDLAAMGVHDFFGVPDSLLAPLTAALSDRPSGMEITADEGAAVGLAIGHHLATGRVAGVFMQNSGLGNAVNPLTSLAHPDIYGVPMLLIIGWRGEMTDAGQIKDEPQHVFQGRITPAMLDVLDVPYRIVGRDDSRSDISEAALAMMREAEHGKPAALVVRKGTFDGNGVSEEPSNLPTREAAIAEALRHLTGVPLVATTGKIGREVYELQQADDFGGPSFLTVGGMGHAAMIAAGIARNTDGKVACFDGDGAVLMHTGSLGTSARCANLIHLVFNNRVHDSVGGNPTVAPDVSLAEIARTFGYQATRIAALDDIAPTIEAAKTRDAASLIEIMVAPGARADLGRPKEHPGDAKVTFMQRLTP